MHRGNETAPTGPRTSPPGEELAPAPIRRILLGLVLLGAVGLTVELLLLDHTEWPWQLAPLMILALGIFSAAVVAVRPIFHTLRLFRAVMVLFVATGLLGVFLHYQGNTEFELEMDAAATGFGLLWRSLRGATPVLAPGALAHLGLFGLVYAYRHPALRHGGRGRGS